MGYGHNSLNFDALRGANIARLRQFKNRRGEPAHSQPDGSDWSLSTGAAVTADSLRDAFRNADEKDWAHLFAMLPDSGHGQFWKAVMLEAKAALAATNQ